MILPLLLALVGDTSVTVANPPGPYLATIRQNDTVVVTDSGRTYRLVNEDSVLEVVTPNQTYYIPADSVTGIDNFPPSPTGLPVAWSEDGIGIYFVLTAKTPFGTLMRTGFVLKGRGE